MSSIKNPGSPVGAEIDIQRMMVEQKRIQENHVRLHPKDEAPKIKLRRRAAKIRKLRKYAEERAAAALNHLSHLKRQPVKAKVTTKKK